MMNLFSSKNMAMLFVFTALLACAPMQQLYAEEKEEPSADDKNRDPADLTDASNNLLDVLRGKLMALKDNDGIEIGSLLADDEQVYKIKSESPKVTKKLMSKDGQKIIVRGKLDKKTMTMTVHELLEGFIAPVETANPRGL